MLALVSIYGGVVTLSQGLGHAIEQAWSLRYWMAPLALGFGLQVGLFTYLRQGIVRGRHAANASVGTSGGISTGSMIACCAHHVSDVLPALGIAGAAAFLASYQTLFLAAGIIANLVGVAFMLEAIQCAGLALPRLVSNLRLRLIRNWSAGLGTAAFAVVLALVLAR